MPRRDFETEAEMTTKDRARTMSYTPDQAKKDDYIIAKDLRRAVLLSLDENTRKFLSEERKTELKMKCERVAELTEGRYSVAIMPYEDLRYALENDANILVGFPSKKNIFAVIDDDARFVGFYIPKSQRQRIIERKVENAISDLREYFSSKGAKMNEDVGDALAKFLWQQKFPYHIPYINIRAIRYEPRGMSEEIPLPNGRILQIEFRAAEGTVYYHIK